MLKLKDYNVAYGQSRVINDMNLEIGEGEIVALVGRNGMGKTTLLKSLIGMVPHQSGSIMLNGQEIGPMESHQRVASGIGFVPQGRMIFSTMTVTENIITGLTTTGEKKIPEDLYELFPVLKEMGAIIDKDNNIIIGYNPKNETSRDILRKVEESGLSVRDFSVSGASLETVFLSITSKK